MPATSVCCRRAPPTALRKLPERNRFFKGLASWIGFRQLRVDYEPAPRAHGTTTWSLWGLIGLSIEGPDVVLGRAAASRERCSGCCSPRAALLFGASILWRRCSAANRCRAIRRWWSA